MPWALVKFGLAAFAVNVLDEEFRIHYKMERWKGKRALVTGASAGIGYCIADALARSGMHIIGCARNLEKIQELAKKYQHGPGSVEAIQCDVSKEEQIKAMFEQIEKKFKYVDVLVNNAGLVKLDDLVSGRTEKWREMLEVNVLGLSICSREALKLLQQNGVTEGDIININSLVGHEHIDYASTHFYAGTKHMVTSLTESLQREVRAMQPKNNIRITDISPGVVATEIMQRSFADVEKAPAPSPAGAVQYEKLRGEDIANGVLYVLSAPPHVNVKTLIICPTQQPQL